ncbi:MAG: radical SAM protein [Promethearchaeota archaeon]
MAVDKGCPFDCGLCPDHEQHSCLAILEVTSACNLQCPVCLAASSSKKEDPAMEQIEVALRKLLKYEGGPTAIQISGGEPTVRRDLCEIVQTVRDLGFEAVEIDTNGIELAKKAEMAQELADAGLTGIYLQFDGFTADVHTSLRGSAIDLLPLKERAIEKAKHAGLAVALAPTVVKGLNENHLWPIVKYAITRGLKGVNFQPFAALGRFPPELLKGVAEERVTISDIVKGLETQSDGQVRTEDFVSVPCPDTRCAVLTYTVVKDGKIEPLNRVVGAEKLLDYYARVADYEEIVAATKAILCEAEDGGSCCPSSQDTLEGQYFSIGCHGLQDIWNIDLRRVKKCCVHELTMDGRLIPFCLYNTSSMKGKPLYRDPPS